VQTDFRLRSLVLQLSVLLRFVLRLEQDQTGVQLGCRADAGSSESVATHSNSGMSATEDSSSGKSSVRSDRHLIERSGMTAKSSGGFGTQMIGCSVPGAATTAATDAARS
jgi:hypothetical protein